MTLMVEPPIDTGYGYIDEQGGVHCWRQGCTKVVMKAIEGWKERPKLILGRRCKCGSYNIIDFERIVLQ